MHLFRNDDKLQRLPFRDWFRGNMPHAKLGYVVEDLDLVLRVYGNRYNTDGDGKFMLIELKFGNVMPGVAQVKTFGLIDKILRQGDPMNQRYMGYYVVNYTDENWDVANFRINEKVVTQSEFKRFLLFEDIGISGWFDSE